MPMKTKRAWLGLGVAGVLLTSTPVWADEAANLLAKMRQAVHTLNYSGTLIYSQGNNLTHYQINHRLENGAEKQSVVQLMPATAAGVPEGAESFSLQKFQQMQPTDQAYRLDLGGQEVVANRSCQIVVARPRDRMRYLQRYCIEPDSGMLLKYSLLDGAHQSVEQVMFTALEIEQAQGGTEPMLAAAPSAAPTVPATVPATDWVFTSLPAGFQLAQDLRQDAINGQPPLRQLILSDGMTSVSVFITPQGSQGVVDSLALSAGATKIYTAHVAGHDVTLVGEVPVKTLKAIAENLQYVR